MAQMGIWQHPLLQSKCEYVVREVSCAFAHLNPRWMVSSHFACCHNPEYWLATYPSSYAFTLIP